MRKVENLMVEEEELKKEKERRNWQRKKLNNGRDGWYKLEKRQTVKVRQARKNTKWERERKPPGKEMKAKKAATPANR